MCESPGFWRWLPQVLFESTKQVPGVIEAMCVQIREPLFESIIGGVATVLFPMMVILDFTTSEPSLISTGRVIFAILTIPSFLIMMHGIYRMEDC